MKFREYTSEENLKSVDKIVERNFQFDKLSTEEMFKTARNALSEMKEISKHASMQSPYNSAALGKMISEMEIQVDKLYKMHTLLNSAEKKDKRKLLVVENIKEIFNAKRTS